MDADNGRDNRVSDSALIRKWSSHASSLVLTLDGAIPSGHNTILNNNSTSVEERVTHDTIQVRAKCETILK